MRDTQILIVVVVVSAGVGLTVSVMKKTRYVHMERDKTRGGREATKIKMGASFVADTIIRHTVGLRMYVGDIFIQYRWLKKK